MPCIFLPKGLLPGYLDFVEVLRCFNFLLKRLEASFWADESPDYPLLVFDAIKNNTAFGKLVESAQNNKPSDEKPWYLAWVHEYFHCVQKLERIYCTVVAKIFDLLLEELQHERFGDARPHTLESAARVSLKRAINVQIDSITATSYSRPFSPRHEHTPNLNPWKRSFLLLISMPTS